MNVGSEPCACGCGRPRPKRPKRGAWGQFASPACRARVWRRENEGRRSHPKALRGYVSHEKAPRTNFPPYAPPAPDPSRDGPEIEVYVLAEPVKCVACGWVTCHAGVDGTRRCYNRACAVETFREPVA